MRGFPEIIAEIGFNRDDDRKKFGVKNRIVCINFFEAEGETKLGFSFNLEREEDDTINLVFDCRELMTKIAQAITEKSD